MGTGEKRLGAKREAGREMRSLRPFIVPSKQRSVVTEESIRVPDLCGGLRKEEGRQGRLRESKSPGGEEKWRQRCR